MGASALRVQLALTKPVPLGRRSTKGAIDISESIDSVGVTVPERFRETQAFRCSIGEGRIGSGEGAAEARCC